MVADVAIVMGSQSDWPTMKLAAKVLEQLGVSYEARIVSAHRTPERLHQFGLGAADEGFKVIIAGAGGAAHLPGMVASYSPLPVVGVPIVSRNSIAGMDSLLSILQMPPGVPVATVATNGARNAGLLALQILGTSDKKLQQAVQRYKKGLEKDVLKKAEQLEKSGVAVYLEKHPQ